jgi:hypothetical protein
MRVIRRRKSSRDFSERNALQGCCRFIFDQRNRFAPRYPPPPCLSFLQKTSIVVIQLFVRRSSTFPFLKKRTTVQNLGQIHADLGDEIILETHSDHLLNGMRLAIKRGLIENRRIKVLQTLRSPINRLITKGFSDGYGAQKPPF